MGTWTALTTLPKLRKKLQNFRGHLKGGISSLNNAIQSKQTLWKPDSTSISKDVKDADRVPEGKITQKELID